MQIELHTTEEILTELFRRFDDVCFAGKRPSEDGSPDKTWTWRWKGDHHTCMGMMHMVSSRIDEHFQESKHDA